MIPKYKDIMELVKKGATVEAQEQIMELREFALGLQEENFDLKEKTKSLEEALQLRKSVQWSEPYYFIVDGENKDGPYCQRCKDVDDNLVRLQGRNNDFWSCFECKANYKGPSYVRKSINYSGS
jgi:hypothetical protein